MSLNAASNRSHSAFRLFVIASWDRQSEEGILVLVHLAQGLVHPCLVAGKAFHQACSEAGKAFHRALQVVEERAFLAVENLLSQAWVEGTACRSEEGRAFHLVAGTGRVACRDRQLWFNRQLQSILIEDGGDIRGGGPPGAPGIEPKGGGGIPVHRVSNKHPDVPSDVPTRREAERWWWHAAEA